MKKSEIYDRAADELERRGRTIGTLVDFDGKMCVEGALSYVSDDCQSVSFLTSEAKRITSSPRRPLMLLPKSSELLELHAEINAEMDAFLGIGELDCLWLWNDTKSTTDDEVILVLRQLADKNRAREAEQA